MNRYTTFSVFVMVWLVFCFVLFTKKTFLYCFLFENTCYRKKKLTHFCKVNVLYCYQILHVGCRLVASDLNQLMQIIWLNGHSKDFTAVIQDFQSKSDHTAVYHVLFDLFMALT